MIDLLILILGYLVLKLLLPKSKLFWRLILSFPTGLGLASLFATFLVINSGISKNIVIPFLLFVNIFLFCILVFKDRKSLWKVDLYSKKRAISSLVGRRNLIVLLLMSGYLAINTLFWPVWDWDALSLYDMRGRFFAEGKTYQSLIDESHFFSNARPEKYYISYPLLTSIAHTFSYLDGIDNPKWIYLFFSIGMLLSFYVVCLDLKIQKDIVLLLTVLLFINPIILRVWTIAYTNSPYMFYIFWSIMAFYYWFKESRFNYILLGSLMLVFSIQTRFADSLFVPILVSFLLALVLSRQKRRFYFFAVPLIFSVFSYTFWLKVVHSLDLGGYNGNSFLKLSFNVFTNFSLSRVYEVAKYFLFASSHFFGIYLVFIVSIFVAFKKIIRSNYSKFRDLLFLLFASLSILGFLLLGIYFMSFTYYKWNGIPGSVRRAILPVFPPLFVFVGLVYKGIQNVKIRLE